MIISMFNSLMYIKKGKVKIYIILRVCNESSN